MHHGVAPPGGPPPGLGVLHAALLDGPRDHRRLERRPLVVGAVARRRLGRRRLPLAAVLATQSIYDGFLDDSRERAFLHSHSYTGNPLACAAALASLDIFESDGLIARNRATATAMADAAATLADLPHVAEVRQAGMVVAFELARDGNRATPFEPAARVGLRAYRKALEHGVLLRPLGDILYWMPPYCIDDAQLAQLTEATRAAIMEAGRSFATDLHG